ncbi:unnamed protein product [Lymnaea stagnalis]|uniref:VPS9 domain-containing protein n=1 Tax=Lymnaea stagnalis TaxID=6523 RepID=A0AAV2H8Z5_LYMST
MWLTFQERVTKVLESISSEPYKIHKINCDRIRAQINIALCEYNMTMSQSQPHSQRRLRSSSGSDISVSLADVKLREKSKQSKNADVRSREVFLIDDIHVTGADTTVMGDDYVFVCETTPADDLQLRIKSDYFAMDRQSVDLKRWSSFPSTSGLPDEARSEDVSSGDSALKFSPAKMSVGQQQLTEQLALSCLMKHVENLKVYNQVAFREVVESLGKYLGPSNLEDTSSQEQTELLWKSYERSFCQEILPDLTNLYTTVLYAGSQSAYQALSKAPLQELLKGDKILNLFFGTQPNSIMKGNVNNSKSRPVDAISIAKTVSSLSLDVRHYDINDLYNLANADSSDLITHFMLEDTDEADEHAFDGSSSGSSDNFYFPGSSPLSGEDNVGSGGLLGSHVSDSDIPTTDDSDSNSENWNGLYTPEQIIEVLDPVLSPFRRYVKKCLDANCFLDKVRYITKAIQDLNQDISRLYGPEHQSACDDIITMLILALSNMPEDIFIGLYVNLRLLMDILPQFLSGTLYDYNLVSLCASYDYLFTRNVCVKVLKRYPGSFKVRPSQ